MQTVCGLTQPPVFCPVVDDYYKGMATTVSLPHMNVQTVWELLSAHYAEQPLVSVQSTEPSTLSANMFAGRDSLTLYVNGHQTQTIVTALFDNLGKGASGAAVQNMNLMLGLEETTGLTR